MASFFSKIQANMPAAPQVDFSAVSKGLKSSVQAGRERFGQVPTDEITALPDEYIQLENRVDALKAVHQSMLKMTKVYESEGYDYPTQVTESVADLSSQFSHGFSVFAEKNLKGTNLPLPTPGAAPQPAPKTLPHALSRSASTGAMALGPEQPLGTALSKYSLAIGKVGEARLAQDATICEKFNAPWSATLSTSIAVAVKARQGVKSARLELDSARQTLKSAGPTKQEQARLDVENCEDKLVSQTEIAISMMKNVLDNPEPLTNLAALVKAQLLYFSTAAEALSAVQGDIETAAQVAQGEYRQSRT